MSADPDVTTIEMNGTEDFIIIACDGLWDTVTPEEATDCVFTQILADKGKTLAVAIFFCQLIHETELKRSDFF